MKTKSLPFRIIGLLSFSMSLLLVILFSSNSFAQTSPPGNQCIENTLGYLDGHVLLKQNVNPQNAAAAQNLCNCASKGTQKFKRCIDSSGKVITGQTSQPGDDKKPEFQQLAGKTNCRLIAPNHKVIMVSNGGLLVGTECQCNQTSDCKCKGEPGCGCDCSCKGSEKWDFIPVDENDYTKGFYIATREENPRAIMRLGTALNLKRMNEMDGKMLSYSQWNIFINNRGKGGNTNYLLRPQDSYNAVLATSTKDGSLIMVNHTYMFSDETSDISKMKPGGAPEPYVMMKNWSCECVF